MEDRGAVLDPAPTSEPVHANHPPSSAVLWLFAGFVSAGLAVYAFTRAFVWDEGFHLLAAQLILAGKKPYIDFCFPQTPLNAYLNALWMYSRQTSWRVPHIPAVLELTGTVFLVAGYLGKRFPEPSWRIPCALAGVAFFGVNTTLVQFGPIAQAYAVCAFTLLSSFMLATGAVQERGVWRAFLSGIAIGWGAASSLLVAPAAIVLLIWLWGKNESGSRLMKALLFLGGCAIPFAPLWWLMLQAPHQTFFNVVQYQALFRRADWKTGTAFGHDFDVLTTWFDTGQALLLCFCAAAAIVFLRRNKGFGQRFRSEYWLALWISLALIAYISTAHPTFARYYIVGMPLYAIVAAPGLMVIASRFGADGRPYRAAAALIGLLLFGLLRAQLNDLDAATWPRYESIAAAVAKVTPPSARLYADEHVYFLLHRTPPSGMEFSYSHKVDLSPKEAALLHIIPAKELKRQVTAGLFATLETCDDDKIDDWDIASLYRQKKEIADCTIFWDYQKLH